MSKYRSKFEANFNSTRNLPYESKSFEYVKRHKYTPDFKLSDSVFLELKGVMPSSDRTKMIACREQNLGLRFILIFQNSKLTLNKGSKTTYGDWATKANFEWYDIKQINDIEAMLKRELI